MADINVTPFVDVCLVLLIIFMVTAPFLQGGLEVDLPKVATSGVDVREGLILSVTADGQLKVGERTVAMADLEGALDRENASRRPVFLKADRRVPYGTVAELIARARRANVASLGLVTEPPAVGQGTRR